MSFKFDDSYIGVLNMDHRTDRLSHFKEQMRIHAINFQRTRGKRPDEFDLNDLKLQVAKNRTPGAIGCHYGQVEIMMKALLENKDAVVFEDDVKLCSDFRVRMEYIENFLSNNPWEIFWLGSTFSIPAYWHTGFNPQLKLDNPLGRDAECTHDPRIMRTFGSFCTYAYVVNKNSILKVCSMLEEIVHESMGIDWAMIKLQPKLLTYAFVPGCVTQIDNKSDIGAGMTIFSNFLKLNGTLENSAYVYQDKMGDFNPLTFNWGEAKIN